MKLRNEQEIGLVEAGKVLAERVKLRREQAGMTQAALADAVVTRGVPLDSTGVLRIEKDSRRVRVDELLAMAAVLGTTPGDLLAPSYARTLTLGNRELDAAQVLAWFAGDRDAVNRRRAARSIRELLDDADRRTVLGDVVEAVELVAEAVERGDGAAILWGAGRAHNALAALVERQLPRSELQRVWSSFDVPEGK